MRDTTEVPTLGQVAYKGFDDYWTEDCRGLDAEAWEASAQAVRAALAQQAAPLTLTDEQIDAALVRISDHAECFRKHYGLPVHQPALMAQFRDIIRELLAASRQAATPVPAEPLAARCVSPHCLPACSACNHAIPTSDTARVLIAELLDAFAVDGHGGPFEDGECALVDKARAFLLAAPPATPAAQPAETPAIDYDALIGHCFKKFRWGQGTPRCSAFAMGAEWYRDQIAAAPSAPSTAQEAG